MGGKPQRRGLFFMGVVDPSRDICHTSDCVKNISMNKVIWFPKAYFIFMISMVYWIIELVSFGRDSLISLDWVLLVLLKIVDVFIWSWKSFNHLKC